jgi:inosine-uridine nucleoside N-ribohydrolase
MQLVNPTRTLILSLTLLAFAGTCSAKIQVVLSTDVGNEIDDQWAIAYLLTSPEFETLGILSAHAPSLPAPSAHATYKILRDEVEHRLNMQVHPPLLEGASLPLANLTTPQPSAAVDFLIRTSKPFSQSNRLNVLVIGAATDLASAILLDPTIVDRINVVAMGFKDLSPQGGREYNVENDPKAWQVILQSQVPVTIGSGDVCRAHLALTFQEAAVLLSGHGPVADWLWSEYQAYYYRNVKPLRVNDFTKPWIIWDIITLAHLRNLTSAKNISRPSLNVDLSLKESSGGRAVWIQSVDSTHLWQEFTQNLDSYTQTHAFLSY